MDIRRRGYSVAGLFLLILFILLFLLIKQAGSQAESRPGYGFYMAYPEDQLTLTYGFYFPYLLEFFKEYVRGNISYYP